MTNGKPLSYLAGFFAVELDSLGEKGFEEWLIDSFTTEHPAPIAPHFQTPELNDDVFGSVYAESIAELDQKKKRSIRIAARQALEVFPKSGKYEGLLSLALISEASEETDLGILLSRILNLLLPPGANSLSLPKTSLEAYCLREILECGFRLVYRGNHSVGDLAIWAYHLAIDERSLDASLKPAFAPLFVLARRGLSELKLTAARKAEAIERLNMVLRSGYFEKGNPFEELFICNCDGERFPYEVNEVIELAERWLSSPGSKSKHDLSSRFTENPLAIAAKIGIDPAKTVISERLGREEALILEVNDG